tara:strand:+ start:6016 stop:7221 length:1206 start_codon:yes stop_codon:yes gene_type:complete
MSKLHEQRASILGHNFVSNAFWRMFPAGMRRRWWLFRFFDLIARKIPIPWQRRGLVVVRMDGIGDMVLFRTSLDHYTEVFGVEMSQITIIGCESWEAISDEVFCDYKTLIINEHNFARRPLYRFWVSLKVRALNPSISVCDSYMRRVLMADSLVWILGAPRTVSSLPFINERTRDEYLFYLSQVEEVVQTGHYPLHEVERHYNFLSAVAGRKIKPVPPQISWRQTKPPKQFIDSKIQYAVLNPGCNEYGRRWPLEKYQQLAKKIVDRGLKVIFIGGHDERLGKINKRGGNVIDLIGKTDLPQLLDLINHAQLVVSNDTGPAHLSIALQTPTLVVVGGGHFGCFVPYPQNIRPDHARFVYHKMDCYHCFWNCPKRASKYDVFPCIEAVEINKVWEAADQLLS